MRLLILILTLLMASACGYYFPDTGTLRSHHDGALLAPGLYADADETMLYVSDKSPETQQICMFSSDDDFQLRADLQTIPAGENIIALASRIFVLSDEGLKDFSGDVLHLLQTTETGFAVFDPVDDLWDETDGLPFAAACATEAIQGEGTLTDLNLDQICLRGETTDSDVILWFTGLADLAKPNTAFSRIEAINGSLPAFCRL